MSHFCSDRKIAENFADALSGYGCQSCGWNVWVFGFKIMSVMLEATDLTESDLFPKSGKYIKLYTHICLLSRIMVIINQNIFSTIQYIFPEPSVNPYRNDRSTGYFNLCTARPIRSAKRLFSVMNVSDFNLLQWS